MGIRVLFIAFLILFIRWPNIDLRPAVNPAAVFNVQESVVWIAPTHTRATGGTAFLLNTAHGPKTITNSHVCDSSNDGKMEVHRHGWPSQVLNIERHTRKYDICILSPIAGLPALSLGRPADLTNVDAAAVGHPGGKALTIAMGKILQYELVSAFTTEYTAEQCDEFISQIISSPDGELICWISLPTHRSTINVERGSSGSPVVNMRGEVISIVFGLDTDTGHSFVVPNQPMVDFINGPQVQ